MHAYICMYLHTYIHTYKCLRTTSPAPTRVTREGFPGADTRSAATTSTTTNYYTGASRGIERFVAIGVH